MPIYTLGYIYQLSDFSTTGGNITPPDERGADADGNPPFQITLEPGYTPIEILVDDDDPNFQETNGSDTNQVLAQDVTIDGVLYEAGQRIVLNYEISTDDGFLGYSITILDDADGNTGRNITTAFMTTEPMQAGQTYTFTSEDNIGGGLGRPYANFVCFSAGSEIDTPYGPQRIERLCVGDPVMTRDHGVQPLVWIGRRTAPGIGDLAPIEIAPGRLGAIRPHRVSPQHRVLIEGALPEMLIGIDEVLVAARHLLDGCTVRQVPTGFVTYVHIATRHHELVRVDGVWSETLLAGPGASRALTIPQQAEIARVFPDAPEGRPMRAARPILRRHEALLVA